MCLYNENIGNENININNFSCCGFNIIVNKGNSNMNFIQNIVLCYKGIYYYTLC